MVVIDQSFSLIDFACCIEVFNISNSFESRYNITYSSVGGGFVYSSAGTAVRAEKLDSLDPATDDIVIVIGGEEGQRLPHPRMRAWLRVRAASCRLCAVGAGVDTLVRSLALETEPEAAQSVEQASPAHRQDTPVARRIGPAWTCRGKTAALDLMLAFVAEDLGRPQALRVAEALLMYVWRRPHEPVFSAIFALQKRSDARFASLHDHIRTNLAEDLRVERLADLCGMTPRTFARQYLQETGMTPAAAVTDIRIEAARTLVESRGLSLARISYLTGFGSELSLRRAFLRAFGKLPTEARH